MADTTPKDLTEVVQDLSESIVDLSKLIGKLNFKDSIRSSNDLGKSIRVSASGAEELLNTFIKFKGVSKESVVGMRKFDEISTRISKDSKLRGILQNELNSELLNTEKQLTEAKIKTLNIENNIARSTDARLTGENNITKITRIRNKLESEMSGLLNIENDIASTEKERLILAGRLDDKYKAQIKPTSQLGNLAKDLYKTHHEIDKIQDHKLRTGRYANGDVAKLAILEKQRNDISTKQLIVHTRLTKIENEKNRIHGKIIDNDRLQDSLRDKLARREETRLIIAKRMIEVERIWAAMVRKTIIDEKLRAGYYAHAKDDGFKMLGSLGGIVNKTIAWRKETALIPMRFTILSALIQFSLDRFIALDKAAEKFRRETGFSIDQMAHIRKYAERVNVEFADMGISIEKAYDSAKALTEQFQITSLVTEEATKNVALMSANLNVAEVDSAQVLSTFQGLGGMTEKMAFNVMKVGAGMSNKIGVPFSLVMKDIANASEQTISMLSANPTMLMRSAIAARTLGTDLNKITASQRKLLDFSSSINDELELSALLGTSISFQKSRQLAYEGRIEDAAKATLATVKAAGNFDKMSVYQREALAKAAGMELKDLSKMMSVDKRRDELKRSGTKEEIARVGMQEAELARLNKMNDLSEQSLADQYDSELRQQKMQGIISNLKNTLDAIVISMADILEPIITPLAKILVPALKLVGVLFRYLGGAIKWLLDPIVAIADKIGKWADGLKTVTSKVSYIKDEVRDLGYYFSDFWTGVQSSFKILAAITTGLFMTAFFGRGGFSGLMSLIAKPFKYVYDLAGRGLAKTPLLGRLIGTGTGPLTPAMKSATAASSAAGSVTSSGTGIGKFLKSFAAGLSSMGSAKVLFGAVNLVPAAIGLVAMVAGIPSLAAIALLGVPFGVGIRAIAAGMKALGNPQVGLGTLILMGISAAFVGFAYAGKLAAEAFGSIAAVLPDAIGPLMKLGIISPLLWVAAGGVTALSVALGLFAGASVGGKLVSFFTGNPLEKFEKFAGIGEQLKTSAKAIADISIAASQFSSINSFADSIGRLADSLGKLNGQLSSMNRENLNKLQTINVGNRTQTTTQSSPPPTATDLTVVVNKLDEIYKGLIGGEIAVYLDRTKVSGEMSGLA